MYEEYLQIIVEIGVYGVFERGGIVTKVSFRLASVDSVEFTPVNSRIIDFCAQH